MSSKVERKLAAIMFTDIVGYTAQMSKDEAVAISLLNKKESILKPLIKEHNGTYVKSTGDGSLSHFNSAVDAAMCAKRLQESIYDDKDLNVRVGVHLGDTIFEKGDVRGEGVNIASRLESMAVEGGVFVSKEVHDQLSNQIEFDDVSLGLQSMKGVGRLIEVFGLKGEKLTQPNPKEYKENRIDKHSDNEVPSIAIIPFENKGDKKDDFYAYGISADLISNCSGGGLIRVAGLKDIEKIDYANLRYKELSKKLLVRYIAQGMLWKRENMFQLSIELYDSKDRKVVWSDRWQEKWKNLPTIECSLADGLLKALDTKPNTIKKIETSIPQAYEYYLRGKHAFTNRKNIDDNKVARKLLEKAIQLDDNFLIAKDFIGYTYHVIGQYDDALKIYESALQQSEKLDYNDSKALLLCSIGGVHFRRGYFDLAMQYYNKGLDIRKASDDKNKMASIMMNIGNVYSAKNDYDKALECYNYSLEIQKKLDDKRSIKSNYGNLGILSCKQKKYDSGIDYLNQALSIAEELDHRTGIANILTSLGQAHSDISKYNKSLNYLLRALKLHEELGNKGGLIFTNRSIGKVYLKQYDLDKALNYYNIAINFAEELSIQISKASIYHDIADINMIISNYDEAIKNYMLAYNAYEELNDKHQMSGIWYRIGNIYNLKGAYQKAINVLKKGLQLNKEYHNENGDESKCVLFLSISIHLNYSYKKIHKDYDIINFQKLIKEFEDSLYYIDNFYIYKCLDDSLYLKNSYNQVIEKAKKLENKFVNNFTNSPIPKAIVEEYKKVFKK